jgi:hypothetical protein
VLKALAGAGIIHARGRPFEGNVSAFAAP